MIKLPEISLHLQYGASYMYMYIYMYLPVLDFKKHFFFFWF